MRPSCSARPWWNCPPRSWPPSASSLCSRVVLSPPLLTSKWFYSLSSGYQQKQNLIWSSAEQRQIPRASCFVSAGDHYFQFIGYVYIHKYYFITTQKNQTQAARLLGAADATQIAQLDGHGRSGWKGGDLLTKRQFCALRGDRPCDHGLMLDGQ